MVAAAIADSASASDAYRAFFAQMLSRVRRSILAVERDAAQIAQLRQEIDGGGAARQCNIETQTDELCTYGIKRRGHYVVSRMCQRGRAGRDVIPKTIRNTQFGEQANARWIPIDPAD